MKDKEGKSYIVEVNGNPGTKIIDITSHNYFVDLVKHLEDKTSKTGAPNQETKAQSTQTAENGFTFRELISNPVNTLQSLFMKEKQGETLTYNEEAELQWHKHHNEEYWKERDRIN